MIKARRNPALGHVAGVALGSGQQVILVFAGCRRSVVARRAGLGNAAVIKPGRCPGAGGVATVAFRTGDNVIARFSGSSGIVVATGAGGGDATVIKPGHLPVDGVVAAVALLAADDMIGRLAGLHGAVVTLRASSQRLAVIEPGDGVPRITAVAVGAGIGGGYVMQRFAARRNHGTASMTGKAVGGRALETTIHMAHFTFHEFVKTLQRKLRSAVIKALGMRHAAEQKNYRQQAHC